MKQSQPLVVGRHGWTCVRAELKRPDPSTIGWFGATSEWILASSVGIVGFLWTLHGVTLSGLTRVPGDIGDSRFNNYVLEHSWRWLLQQPLHSSFWNMPIFYPAANTLAYSDLMVSFGPFYWIWRALGLDEGAAYLGWFFLISVLNYLLAYMLLRFELRISWTASLLGAFIVAYSVGRIEQIGHPQLYPLIYVLMPDCCFQIFWTVAVGRVGKRGSQAPGMDRHILCVLRVAAVWWVL